MDWETFKEENRNDFNWFPENRKITDIDCPKCGKKIYLRTDIILTSYPPKHQYECDCGWVGYN